ncbi:hypothetical protein ACVWZ3_001888 [Bradyrhizobium sp. i1.3.6]
MSVEVSRKCLRKIVLPAETRFRYEMRSTMTYQLINAMIPSRPMTTQPSSVTERRITPK